MLYYSGMLYTSKKKNFQHHVHPTLQRRIKVFLVISTIMFAIVLSDVVTGTLGPLLAVLALVGGGAVGWFTSRIFHLSWSHDGQHVVGQIDKIGWLVLAAYIIFEIARVMFFDSVLHVGVTGTAITFAFVSAALCSRVLGLRGRIMRILEEENIFG